MSPAYNLGVAPPGYFVSYYHKLHEGIPICWCNVRACVKKTCTIWILSRLADQYYQHIHSWQTCIDTPWQRTHNTNYGILENLVPNLETFYKHFTNNSGSGPKHFCNTLTWFQNNKMYSTCYQDSNFQTFGHTIGLASTVYQL